MSNTLGMKPKKVGYPSDVTDEEWEFCCPLSDLDA